MLSELGLQSSFDFNIQLKIVKEFVTSYYQTSRIVIIGRWYLGSDSISTQFEAFHYSHVIFSCHLSRF